MERERYNDLEKVVMNERQQLQQKDFHLQDLERKNINLESEVDR